MPNLRIKKILEIDNQLKILNIFSVLNVTKKSKTQTVFYSSITNYMMILKQYNTYVLDYYILLRPTGQKKI